METFIEIVINLAIVGALMVCAVFIIIPFNASTGGIKPRRKVNPKIKRTRDNIAFEKAKKRANAVIEAGKKKPAAAEENELGY